MSLDKIGIDVVPRAIKLNNNTPQLPERILELEKKNCNRPDVVIQHILPHLMDYSGKIKKNIALYATETSNFRNSSWSNRINNLNEAWVINHQSKQASLDSGITIPINVIPHATDISRFTRSYNILPFRKELPEYSFIFYTIGEVNRRKNLSALIKAFHLEFRPEEPVELLIKTTPVGIKGPQTIESQCNEIKQYLKLYKNINSYKKEIIITDYTTTEYIMNLHHTCDCFVLPSYGEAWSLPAFDSMGMGKTPIVTDCTGFKDYLSNDTGWLVPSTREPVFGVTNTNPDTFTGKESWWSINIEELQKAMREAYENRQLKEQKAIAGMKRAYDFSYEKIGHIMKEVLHV